VRQQIGAGGAAIGIEGWIPKLREHAFHYFAALAVNAPTDTDHNCLTVRLIGALRRSVKPRTGQLKEPCRTSDKHYGVLMVRLTRLNQAPLVLNSDLIEHIDSTPDTVITLTNGQILRVRETADEVVERIVEFRRKIHGLGVELPLPSEPDPDTPEPTE
jgi:flagellar protein FlbD